ncbi:flagellar hook-length control protein FliK [Neisseriaceae bacterium TC5R-5]|nr:flagellar hook-length control protein FliK [Neisseriaceae bacterium TC5R-5]
MTMNINTASSVVANSKPSMPGSNVAEASAAAGGGDLFASLLGLQMNMSTLGASFLPSADTNFLAPDKKADDAKPIQTGESVLPDSLLLAALPAAIQAQYQVSPDSLSKVVDTADSAKLLNLKPDVQSLLGADNKPAHLLSQAQQDLPDSSQLAVQFLPTQTQTMPQQEVAINKPLNLAVALPVNDPNWGKAMSEQVLGMVSLKNDKAQIQLNPPQMGPIEITLKMNGNEQAQVLFVAAVPATREALESNMHRLTSMLAASGIQLTDSQVSSGQSGQQQQAFQRGAGKQAIAEVEVTTLDALAPSKTGKDSLSIFA